MNVFQYSAKEQAAFTRMMADCGYKTFTTFFGDLSIAEWYGTDSIKDTYNNVVESWGKSHKYFTEFVMCLNHKGWEFYNTDKQALSDVYFDLFRKAQEFVDENFTEEEKQYYYEVTD